MPLTTVCITRTGQEGYLCTELHHSIAQKHRTSPVQCTQSAPQTVVLSHESHEDLCRVPLFFSSQCLPDSQIIKAASISAWATAVLEHLLARFGDAPQEWCLHVFEPASAETGKQYARSQRVQETILELLKQKRRSYLRTLKQDSSPTSTIVQVAMIEPTSGYISFADAHIRSLYRAALSRVVAGYVSIPDDTRPPSRAFKKLREAIDVFALTPQRGEAAVDLGASPGGWTHVLRDLGLAVTAIDRSPLAPPLMRDRKVNWQAGNALTWYPPTPVDWLVCDVITTPENTASLLQAWVSKRLCKHFCVTVKFKGAPAIDTLLSLSAFLLDHTVSFDARQLTHNKNEVTLVGTIR